MIITTPWFPKHHEHKRPLTLWKLETPVAPWSSLGPSCFSRSFGSSCDSMNGKTCAMLQLWGKTRNAQLCSTHHKQDEQDSARYFELESHGKSNHIQQKAGRGWCHLNTGHGIMSDLACWICNCRKGEHQQIEQILRLGWGYSWHVAIKFEHNVFEKLQRWNVWIAWYPMLFRLFSAKSCQEVLDSTRSDEVGHISHRLQQIAWAHLIKFPKSADVSRMSISSFDRIES